ncbi:MAG: M55 family metallopeptidase [Gemmatimonadetes bacterium]|nr:M55 family metallopeptidase [Gemmatimonadota bacterium]
MPSRAIRLLAGLVLLSAPARDVPAQQARPVKIYLSVDMEGVTGVVTGDQLSPAGFEYQRFREIMTEEAVAAIGAARAAGATEFVISDSHGNAENLLIERLPEDVTVVRGFPRPLVMMQGIDSTFAGALLIGYHAPTHYPSGVRAHTMSSARLTEIRFNGRPVSEAALSGAIAGRFGVPIIMISGDDAAVAEAKSQLGEIESAVVKWNYGFHSARTLTPAAGKKVIAERVSAAMRRLRSFQPLLLTNPVTVDVRFKSYRPAEVLAYLPVIERPDAHSIRFVGRDVLEAVRFLEFLTTYTIELEP